jgi:hypothetical protein
VYDAPQIKADRRPSALSVFEKSWPLQDGVVLESASEKEQR